MTEPENEWAILIVMIIFIFLQILYILFIYSSLYYSFCALGENVLVKNSFEIFKTIICQVTSSILQVCLSILDSKVSLFDPLQSSCVK